MTERDAQLAVLASKQQGHFTRRQALGIGFTEKMAAARLRSGLWVKTYRGFYRLAGVPARPRGEAEVAALCLPGGVVSHQSAGRRHAFTHMGDRPITVTVRSGTTHDLPGVVVHESTDLVTSDCVEVDRVLYTDPVRTLIDLAAHLKAPVLSYVVDDLLRDRLVSVEAASTRLEQLARRGKPGVRALRSVLEARSDAAYVPPESVFESKVLELLGANGFPAPERQASLPWRPAAPERLDLLYRQAKLILECDGRRWHTRERDFARDRRRDNEALVAGWRVFRITWDELVHHPARLLRDLDLLLQAADAA